MNPEQQPTAIKMEEDVPEAQAEEEQEQPQAAPSLQASVSQASLPTTDGDDNPEEDDEGDDEEASLTQQPQQQQQPTTIQNKPISKKLSKRQREKNRVRKRCGECENCVREDCGQCVECVRKIKFGGTGGSKQACIQRRCVVLEQLKRERKRNRAAGLPLPDNHNEWDTVLLERANKPPTKKAKRRRSGSGNSGTISNLNGSDTVNVNGSMEKDPLVAQLQQAYADDPPPSMLASELANPAPPTSNETTDTQYLSKYKYGRTVPPQTLGICAGCKCERAPTALAAAPPVMAMPMEGELQPLPAEPVILLCDGPGCNTEWHIECCMPPISQVPKGAYYCLDCSASGASTVLEQYFDRMEDRRADAIASSKDGKDAFAFLHQLWEEELEDNQDNYNPDEHIPAKDGRVPQSELYDLLHLQQHLVGSSNSGHWAPNKPVPFDDLASLLLGKPVRLYCPLDDNYHSGRIVDYRRVPANLHHLAATSTSTSSKKVNSKSSLSVFLPNDDFFASHAEFLLRFSPGSEEYRKTPLYRWVRLEEHSLAVGTHLIWGKFHNFHYPMPATSTTAASPPSPSKKGGATVTAQFGSSGGSPAIQQQAAWQQGCIFLRTSRELMPVLHLLKEKAGEVSYHPASLLTSSGGGKSSKKKDEYTIPRAPPKKKAMWCLAKRFGVSQNQTAALNVTDANHNNNNPATSGEAYKMLHLTDETRDLFSRKPSNSHIEQLKQSLAQVEYDEQQAVIEWRNMKRRKLGYSAPNALRMRDEQALGPVLFEKVVAGEDEDDKKKNEKDEQELCPLFRAPGLDRGYLMKRLLSTNLVEEATKDTAAGLQCWLVPE